MHAQSQKSDLSGGIVPFSFQDRSVRIVTDERGEPLFVGKDVCEALGYANESDAMKRHCKGVVKRYPLQTAGGLQEVRVLSEPDVLRLIVSSTLPAAQAFESWIFDEVLPTIRRTGSYGRPQVPQIAQVDPVRDLLLIREAVASVTGVNAALAMAYTLDAIERSTGLPASMLSRALPSVQPEDAATLNATQVGQQVGLKAAATNKALVELGLLTKGESGAWMLTEAGTAFGEAKPFHRRGHSGYEVRWKPAVVSVLRDHIEAREEK